MRTFPSPRAAAALLMLVGGGSLAAAPVSDTNSAGVKKLFARPTREFSSGPLWVWNDALTERQIRDSLRDLAGQQVRQVWVHPRPGLMTPYLGPEWFRLWRVALAEAERLDLNVWIYDENSYPSGFAGGWVPELMPEARGRGLHFREVRDAPSWNEATLAVFRLAAAEVEDVSATVRARLPLDAGPYLVAEVRRAGDSPWYGNRCYVDLLYPGVTEKFLEITLEAYRRAFGDQFGRRVPGSFTDEPQLRPAGGLPWTEDLPEQFQRRWGYGLIENLASLARPVGDWRRVRHNYYATLNELFIERWARPYFEYCARQGLEFTGHYWEHEWPNCGAVPDNMALYAWQQRPGIDTLMNQYAEHTHAQFGNVRAVRELNSIANQLGRRRTLCEVYGAGGWDLRFVDMKRIADWLGVLGVNTFNQHLSYLSLRGARKRDHPQSFSYHEPWWESYHVAASYLARLSVAVSAGEQVNRILVLEPTTTAWMYQGDAARLKELGDAFFNLLMSLEAAQIEYDLGCEDVLSRHGAVSPADPARGPVLQVGRRRYDVVVLPPHTENVNGRTAQLGEEFLAAGGRVISLGPPPTRVDGLPSSRPAQGAQAPGWITAAPADAPRLLREWSEADGFSIRPAPDDQGRLFHMRRRLGDGQLVLLVNTSDTHPSAGVIRSRARGVERWDLDSGQVEAYAFEHDAGGVQTAFHLPPVGSLLLFFADHSLKPAVPPRELVRTVPPTGPLQVRRLAPNVLTLDYVDVTAGGETRREVYFYQANQFVWQQHGLARNPWDNAVQFKDELIAKTFAPTSGFEVSYRFRIKDAVPADLAIVIERPDLYTVTCNGRPVRAKPGDWWLDKSFGRVPLAEAARTGDNVVTLQASPFTMLHELESAYVLGDFALEPADRGFVIAPARPLQTGPWNEQGHPFYAGGVSYRQEFHLAKRSGRFRVALPRWLGSVAKVLVNGKLAGHVVAPPWECDVTRSLRRGHNTVEVIVVGTLKNTLGPHHGNPALGTAWPGMFQKGPTPGPPAGAQYSTVGYGLFEPFVLRQVLADRD